MTGNVWRRIFKDVKYFATICGVSEALIQMICDLWIALREPLPRPIDPEKLYNFGQKIKDQYDKDVPWMKNHFSTTLHKIIDHPREVLKRLPDTLRISML